MLLHEQRKLGANDKKRATGFVTIRSLRFLL